MVQKIAIATMIGQNQGNRLQNYALQTVLERMSGARIETLRVGYGPDAKKRLAKRLLFRLFPSKRWAHFEEFDRLYIRYSNRSIEDVDLDSSDYDLYIIGSDQVWNPTFSFTGESEYLPQVSSGKKASYAASFGVSEVVDKRGRTSELLDDIKYISVREKAGQKVVENLTGRTAQLVLDPTMLISIDDWRAIAKRPAIKIPSGGYVLKYVLGENISDDQALEVSGLQNHGIIDLKDRELPVGPREFVWLVDHADYICTDSFHASVFSILTHTPFAIFERVSLDKDMSSRFDTLCCLFALEDRRVNSLASGEIVADVDWSHVDLRLEIERRSSYEFLELCLHDANLC